MTAPTEPRLPGGGTPHPNPPRTLAHLSAAATAEETPMTDNTTSGPATPVASGTPAAAFINDALGRAQANFAAMLDLDRSKQDQRMSLAWFIHHTTIVILLENLRRLDPDLADRLVPWALGPDGIFTDSYAGELTYEWRQQLTAGEPLHPIAPDATEVSR